MRARKPKHIEERKRLCKDFIVDDPSAQSGHWSSFLLPRAREVCLDLGCGKGAFCIEAARRNPDVLFIGIDVEEICIVLAAQRAQEARVYNAVFVLDEADDPYRFFAEGELSRMYLNYPTPYPQSKAAWRRLTYLDRLLRYRFLLNSSGSLHFKTDSSPLYRFTLTQLALAHYQVCAQTENLLHEDAWPQENISTEYEKRLVQKGAAICALIARPQAFAAEVSDAAHLVQTASLSLVDYLPDDLENLTYVPYGMEDTVKNLLNRRANLEKKR